MKREESLIAVFIDLLTDSLHDNFEHIQLISPVFYIPT